ncbi:hypothetical protein R1flu_019325 [Riccia fluitans]|uniref:Uncharacterized protein n=1 Tax=Riccia fluitans TaxID=41844 RepID=A0ABD1ZIC0_9MARC
MDSNMEWCNSSRCTTAYDIPTEADANDLSPFECVMNRYTHHVGAHKQQTNFRERAKEPDTLDAGEKKKVDADEIEEECGFTEENRKAREALSAKDIEDLELEQVENMLEAPPRMK